MKKMKNCLLMMLLAGSFLNSNAQKITYPTLKEKITVKEEPLQTNLNKDSIMKYIKSVYVSYQFLTKEFIRKVEENMEFDKMYLEKRSDHIKHVIIPMKKVYFSQHAINQKNPPIQYVVVVEDDKAKGKVSSVDLMLVFPKDKNLTALPKNAFFDFSAQNTTQIDATYTLVNFADVKQAELKVENGKRKKLTLWSGKINSDNNSVNICKDWTLETDIYNDDGTYTTKKENLGKTCTACPPGFKCDAKKK